MKHDEAIGLLRTFEEELRQMTGAIESDARFRSWQHRVRSVLTKTLGESHHITQSFVKLHWSISFYAGNDHADRLANQQTFAEASQEALGLLDAAIFELEQLQQSMEIAEDAGLDAELWDHVKGHVVAEEWTKVASQTAIFTEDRIRK